MTALCGHAIDVFWLGIVCPTSQTRCRHVEKKLLKQSDLIELCTRKGGGGGKQEEGSKKSKWTLNWQRTEKKNPKRREGQFVVEVLNK